MSFLIKPPIAATFKFSSSAGWNGWFTAMIVNVIYQLITVVSTHTQNLPSIKIDKNQKDFILREEIQAIREELGEDNYEEDVDRLRSMTEKLNAPDEIKDRIFREISRYNTLSGSSAEASVSRGYIETMLELPWNKRSKTCCIL